MRRHERPPSNYRTSAGRKPANSSAANVSRKKYRWVVNRKDKDIIAEERQAPAYEASN